MKAISPVIATVIIVAVAIAISIAVALWITGLTSSFTGVEKLEIVNAYATKSGSAWTVYITAKNTGTKPATIDDIFINNKPIGQAGPSSLTVNINNQAPITTPATGFSFTINAGGSADIQFDIPSGTYSSGQTVSIVIHTASGGQYPATITLP
ncbi:hypothetical protein [Staphylothermus hellenicus]|uniref:DUF4352 domain-containing protein n=1 Tax=Staphylothermus hellenicus (strain DSM 12710 / JCM 10830 / BK20S6-10-b1 / P8) TaxID=591019 RepID=D7D8I1_STAHD|nr:hypothetical protein [Staphylothermus hellenicus]ADI32077.1 hypothetical protein Shell_0971 [Staphylothermus hellenicus DSM 12710]